MHFSELGLMPDLLKALAAEGYETPTPIQSQAIPIVLKGADLLGVAQTGTGKTAAFALPILQHLAKHPVRPRPRACRVLVLAPTRELASQIEASFRAYGRFTRPSTTVIFGGIPVGRQVRTCANGLDVVVATPGRLLDLVNQRALILSDVEVVVFDEADQMLDMGFIHDIKRIVSHLPAKRQSLFFSATMPKEIAELAAKFLHNPEKVAVTPVASTVERIAQQVIFCEARAKQALLVHLLQGKKIERALVFSRTKHGADRIVKNLVASGIPADAIHGNKSQAQRERALGAFRAGRSRLLVATDIAARGIDIDDVSHVINFDLPNIPESYVHRIGRTARAGADGIAISFCDGSERAFLRDIERLIRQRVPVLDNPLPASASTPHLQAERPAQEPVQQQRKPQGQRPGGHGQAGHGAGAGDHARRPGGPSQHPRNRRNGPRRDGAQVTNAGRGS